MLRGAKTLRLTRRESDRWVKISGFEPATVRSETIKSISVVGAERLEPTTILSYIRLRVGQEYTSTAADEALKDLGATELFANFSIRNDNGNVVITVTENPVINRIVLTYDHLSYFLF